MDDQEIHYLTYDPDAVWTSMILAYIDAGGDVLYPGDEKEIFLRGVQQMIIQTFAGIDNALRMDTLRYAVRGYLDLYGEKRNCYRLQAVAATATAEITFRATGKERIIEAGTPLTAGGDVLYLLEEDVTQTGYAQTITVSVVCGQTGNVGNGLLEGMQMQFLTPHDGVESVFCSKSASGGQDEEQDEAYRERIRTYGLSNVTTGPQMQYESAAKNVTNEIVDARALNLGAGNVGVYLILASDIGEESIIQNVKEALNDKSVRPLTDYVQVFKAKEKSYTLSIRYYQGANNNIAAAVNSTVKEYQAWQDNSIGRAFNPDKLMAMLYQAGATRVMWEDGSTFDGGAIAYTEVPPDTRCKGSITLAVMDG